MVPGSVRRQSARRRGWGALLALATGAVALGSGIPADATAGPPEGVIVSSGRLELHARLWKPAGGGPFPAVLFAHGSGNGSDWLIEPLGLRFARQGYIFLMVYRRGSGPSAEQGSTSEELMQAELAAHGAEARNELQVRLLETDHLDDTLAALAYLRGRPDVDQHRLAIIGHSFGGALALLAAERDHAVAAVVDFSGGANSWARSARLRARLRAAVDSLAAPVFFIHAANDYSIAPGQELSAEMERLGRPHRLKIYPAVGRSAEAGHAFVFLQPEAWAPDVFAFLDECLRR